MRRPVLTALLAAAIAAGWLTRGWWSPPADLPRDAAQNILLVTIDTLRADALGCYGGAAATPVIDALAAAGLRFTFAHAHAVVTLPSHASILTGRYPFEHGLRENSGYRLQEGMKTLPQLLKARGIATGAFVGAFPLDARFGLTPGFDEYDGRFDDMAGAAAFALPERPATAVVDRASRLDCRAARPSVVRLGSRFRSSCAVCTAGALRSASTRRVPTLAKSPPSIVRWHLSSISCAACRARQRSC